MGQYGYFIAPIYSLYLFYESFSAQSRQAFIGHQINKLLLDVLAVENVVERL